MAERDEFGAFLLGFIIGGLAGAVATLMMAPQSGEETRTVIKERAIELRDKAAISVDEATEQIDAVAVEARARIDELSKAARQNMEDLQKRGATALEDPRAKISDAIQKGMKAVSPKASSDGEAAA